MKKTGLIAILWCCLCAATALGQRGATKPIDWLTDGVDVATGKMLWHRHWTYEGQVQTDVDPRHLGFLRPGGSSDTPVIGPEDANGRRPIYFITGDGMLHILNAATGEDLEP